MKNEKESKAYPCHDKGGYYRIDEEGNKVYRGHENWKEEMWNFKKNDPWGLL